MPAWRIAFLGFLAAFGVAAIGYVTHERALYVFAVFAGALIGVFGFILSVVRASAQIKDAAERKRFAEKHKSTALRLFQVLAIPTAIVGGVLIYDLFIATPQHDTAVIIGKYVSNGGKGGSQYNLQVKGVRVYQKAVPFWFYNDCSLNDTVEL